MTAPDRHPSWCVGVGCQSRGWHASRPLVVTGTDNNGAAATMLRIVQLLGDAEPHITLTGARVFTAGDEPPALLLSLRQARTLRRFLLVLAQRAER